MTDAELAAELAEEAGRILLDLRANGGLQGKPLSHEGDRTAKPMPHAFLTLENVD